MGHLILQAPGAAVTMSGACDCWVQTHLNPPSPTWETWVVLWSGVPAPAWVLLGLALWVAFPWTGTIPHSGVGQGCGALTGQKLSCDMNTWLDTGSGKSLCLCPCPHLTAGVCCRLRWVQGGEMAPVGRAHAAAGSPFASEEPGGNC